MSNFYIWRTPNHCYIFI